MMSTFQSRQNNSNTQPLQCLNNNDNTNVNTNNHQNQMNHSVNQQSHQKPNPCPIDPLLVNNQNGVQNKIKTKFGTNYQTDIKDKEETALEDWQLLKEMTIEGTLCKLVPYTRDHVKTYNAWLNDADIQQSTQTEPYSLEQEYEYQQEWKSDESKYIFIVLDKKLNDAMAGDINVFVVNDVAELNIMIAEPKSRRRGIATETLRLIIQFASTYLELKTFIAKIAYDNESSIKLFKKLGFVETEFVEAFKEYTFTLTLKDNHDTHHSEKQNSKLKSESDSDCEAAVKHTN